jgi:hypothetical protein
MSFFFATEEGTDETIKPEDPNFRHRPWRGLDAVRQLRAGRQFGGRDAGNRIDRLDRSAPNTFGGIRGFAAGCARIFDTGRQLRRLSPRLVAILLVALATTAGAQAQCERVVLQGDSPRWITGVTVWSEKQAPAHGAQRDKDVLLIGDASRGRLLAVDSAGHSRDKTRQFTRGIDGFYPEKIKALPDGEVVLQLSEGRIRSASPFGQLVGGLDMMPLDPEKRKNWAYHADAANAGGGKIVEMLWQWGVVEEESQGRFVIGFADVYDSGTGQWVFGMVKVPWRGQWQQYPPKDVELLEGDFKTLQAGAFDGQIRTLFRLGYDLVATFEDRAYVLRPGEETTLLGFSLKGEAGFVQMGHEDLALGAGPDLPKLGSLWTEYRSLIDTLAAESYAVAIYPYQDDLLVLYREPGAEGTRWSLQRLALSSNGLSIEGVSPRLPIQGLSANSVWVASGTSGLFFVEQGRLGEFFGRQETESVYKVPTAALKVLTASSAGQGPLSICR